MSDQNQFSGLDERLKLAQARKLEIEARVAEAQFTPNHRRIELLKAVSGTSGMVLAFLALFGALASTFNWFREQQVSRGARAQERLERAIRELSAPPTEVRMPAITALSSQLSPNEHSRNFDILFALANRMPFESSLYARSAIIAVFRSVDKNSVQQKHLDQILHALADSARSMLKEKLDNERNASHGVSTCCRKIEVKPRSELQDTASVMAILLRLGARPKSLSDLYLGEENLEKISLPKMVFDNSILAGTNFSGADLAGASFFNANLEGARFVGANLQDANLAVERFDIWPRQEQYAVRETGLSADNLMIGVTVFRCANLKAAKLRWRNILGFASNAASSKGYYGFSLIFAGANIDGADLQNVTLYTLAPHAREQAKNIPFAEWDGIRSKFTDDLSVYMYRAAADAKLDRNLDDFSNDTAIKSAFSRSNWKSAMLPKWLKEYLQHNEVPSIYKRTADSECQPKASW